MESVASPIADEAWSPAGVDEAAFDAGRLGPYRLGPSARRTAFGEVILALPEEARVVVEIERLEALVGTPLAAPDGALMADIAAVAALRHRSLLPMVGAGVHDGVPYIARPHRLGRTLESLLAAGELAREAAAAILYAVSDTLAFLAEQGPDPNACAVGGLDTGDVYLGYDGSIALVGLGLKRARGHADRAAEADLASCLALARALEPGVEAGLSGAIAGARSYVEINRAIRRRFGAACAHAPLHVGSAMRRAFGPEIAADRAFFGLDPLQ